MWTYLLSWFLVAFGTPSLLPSLMPLAALGGYALFWRSIAGIQSRFALSFIWFFFVGLVHFSWIATTTYNGPLMWIVYLFVVTAQAALWGLVNRYFSPVGCAGAWTAVEWARQFFLCGFPFSPVGQALGFWPAGVQLASVFGSSILTWSVLMTGALMVTSWRQGLVIGLAPYAVGALMLMGKGEEGEAIEVALIEPKIAPPVEGRCPKGWHLVRTPYENWELYFPSLEKLRETRPALIGFPEAAFSDLGDIDCIDFAFADGFLRTLFGEAVVEHYPDHGSFVSHAFMLQVICNTLDCEAVSGMMVQVPGGVANAAVHFRPAAPHHVYGKRRLLPVAESMSLGIFRWIGADFGIFDSFIPSQEPVVFSSRFGKIFPSVCYEEAFSSISLEAQGSDLLFNVTNDGWYPLSRLEKEQKALARLRSVETGLPSVRACNTGCSGGFDRWGRELPALKSGDVTYVTCDLSKRTALYGVVADWLLLLICTATVGLSLLPKKGQARTLRRLNLP